MIIKQSNNYPLYGTRVSCGFPSPADDYIENKLSLDDYIIKNPASTFFVKALGESMKPTINGGDLLVIDRSLEPQNDNIILAILNGEFTVKRFKILKEKLYLIPDNPKHNKVYINQDTDFEVWGVITTVIHNTR